LDPLKFECPILDAEYGTRSGVLAFSFGGWGYFAQMNRKNFLREHFAVLSVNSATEESPIRPVKRVSYLSK
jgi:hypothetical protein